MTVKEAFCKAFGEVPEGATCHIGCDYGYDGYRIIVYEIHGLLYYHQYKCPGYPDGGWMIEEEAHGAHGPDISDRPAESFIGFFGAEFDAVLAVMK